MRSIAELISLKNRRALITGACGHLGEVMAITISELGGDLVLIDLPDSNLNALARKIKKLHDVKVETIGCDLERKSSRKDLIDKLNKDKEGLDILINSAALVGTSALKGWTTKFEDQNLDAWNRALEVNLTAIFDLTKGLSPKLRLNKRGSIINIASTYGVVGPDYSLYEGTNMGNPAAYAASKGGVIQLTKWLATTLAEEIRVNSISPGGILRNQPKKFIARYSSKTPLKRMAKEEDFKGITAYLASDLSEYVTGQNFLVDGGWTVW